jgi:hypothetical protein
VQKIFLLKLRLSNCSKGNVSKPDVVVHAYNPSTPEAEAAEGS